MAACLAALAVGCGGEEDGNPIPADVRGELEGRLTEAENRLDDGSFGACDDILSDTEPSVGSILATMPGDVDPDVRQRVEQGFDRLWELVESECDLRRSDEQAEPETTPEPEPPPPEETDTETVPTTPEPEPEEDGGGGEGGEGGGGDEGGGDGGSGGGDQGGIDIPGAGEGGGVAPGEG
jgi:hypothetical protein